MALTPDQIIDRSKLKAQISKWRIFAVIAITLIIWLIIGKSSDLSPKYFKSQVSGHIARVFIDGTIDDNFERTKALKDIIKNSSIKALIIHINSPGGTVVGGETLYKALRKISSKKPIVVVMGEIATSAAYMTALGGDHILASEGTITGSIGVIVNAYEVTELAKKVGVEFNTLKTSPFKAALSPFEKLTPETAESVNEVLLDSYNSFYEIVKTRRKLPDTQMKLVADGRVYTGKQALKLKLIDAIGGEEEAVDWLIKNKKIITKLQIKEFKLIPPESSLTKLLELTSQVSSLIQLATNKFILQ